MKNEVNKTDIEWLVLKMEGNLEKEKRRLERLEDQVNNFHAFLDNKVTQAEDFLGEMERSLSTMRQTFVDLDLIEEEK